MYKRHPSKIVTFTNLPCVQGNMMLIICIQQPIRTALYPVVAALGFKTYITISLYNP